MRIPEKNGPIGLFTHMGRTVFVSSGVLVSELVLTQAIKIVPHTTAEILIGGLFIAAVGTALVISSSMTDLYELMELAKIYGDS